MTKRILFLNTFNKIDGIPELCCSVLSHFKDSKYQLGIGLFQFSEEKLLSLEALIVYLKIPSVILSRKELQLNWRRGS